MKQFDIYKCGKCGVLLESIIVNGDSEHVLENLELLVPKTQDASTEKHVPYIEEKEDGYLVKVGKDAAHPMLPEHYIEFIEIFVDDFQYRKFLKPGEAPEAYFKVPKGSKVSAKEYCNIHGLWKDK
ncbi:MAG: desulfoferrodoxin family protein [Cetobacterium sp.]|uniref:desulfoferrodoxin family protein n=1 Tax=unclassified Cetobacterium TaxID=2630983 RepID=UPI00163C864F|nr:desulfoferrodoxin family protein [Cetobacterium sp. 2A]MBC2856265.1 desulfoferrodoxin [Cetobacterium sp. 2A]